ncbi:MAG: NADH-quinone oxidoreductase subunit A [Dehalococcoidales bacterium]|nr:NADH-quinone oxidoreductase subunit A [Dehalococcoidales bacterium]
MLTNYGYIALLMVITVFFASSLIIIPVVLKLLKIAPSNPTPTKGSPFECGMETIGRTWVQFNFRYYFYALVLIALDVMVAFLYPWAVDLRQLGVTGLAAALIFVAIVVVGYIYAWRKKVLEW